MIRDEDRELGSALGSAARSLRQAQRSSQEQVAAQVGISPQVYARMERGQVLPSLRTLVRLAEVLGCSPSALLDSASAKARATARTTATASHVELTAIGRYAAQLDGPTRRHLLGLLRKLAGGKAR